VELAVLPTGIDSRWEIGEQALVIASPSERAVELARIDADEQGLEAGRDEVAGELGSVPAPEREQSALAAAARRPSR
jgi:hypothetical protein